MANSYSATVTPFRTTVFGLPITTFTATCISLLLYLIAIVLIFATDCPMNTRVSYFLAFLIVAVLALCCMAAINMMYHRYRFNCLSLSVSLLYSGSAALVILGLIMTAIDGLCVPSSRQAAASSSSSSSFNNLALNQQEDEKRSLFRSRHVGNYFIWALAAIGDAFQIVAHYYYG